ncbi:hypothetical protein ON010_g78 [Phytophthora cinnamomi]|nr:hypothetical protein ON010_g78 [Phytophthora cinnamomi]
MDRNSSQTAVSSSSRPSPRTASTSTSASTVKARDHTAEARAVPQPVRGLQGVRSTAETKRRRTDAVNHRGLGLWDSRKASAKIGTRAYDQIAAFSLRITPVRWLPVFYRISP